MLKTIKKVFFLWEHEKEEKWLNEMSAAGFQLRGVGFCTYHFEEGTPGEYIYRLEMLENWPTNYKSVLYIKFLEETGVEHIGSLIRWVYFRKKADDGSFDIYSDVNSRITHYNRMLLLLGILALANLVNALNVLTSWIRFGGPSTLLIALLCFTIWLLLGYGFVRIHLKKRKLNKEKILHE